MKSFSCPACGGELVFRNADSLFQVCSYCKSMIVQEGDHLKDYGKMAVLQEDMSPLQLGTTGIYNNRGFTVVGRLKMAWDGGFWNEWYLNFGAESGWLGEAQGFYGISFEQKADLSKIPKRSEIRRGGRVQIADYALSIDDIKTARVYGTEGELPFVPFPNQEYLSVDLGGVNGEFGTISYSANDVMVYFGRYVDFENLKFKSLRQLDGW